MKCIGSGEESRPLGVEFLSLYNIQHAVYSACVQGANGHHI